MKNYSLIIQHLRHHVDKLELFTKRSDATEEDREELRQAREAIRVLELIPKLQEYYLAKAKEHEEYMKMCYETSAKGATDSNGRLEQGKSTALYNVVSDLGKLLGDSKILEAFDSEYFSGYYFD